MKCEKIMRSLERNGYKVVYFEECVQAEAYLLESIKGVSVGFGDSATLESMNLADRLAKENEVFDPSQCGSDDFISMGQKALITEVFLTSVNGVSETGELVNIDGTGNRLAGSLFGHKRVYFVFGTNKIEPTLEKAIWRARNVAAPMNAKRFGYKTPCAIKGDRCYDCSSPDRICNAMTIYFKKMDSVEAEVIIINENLGM